MPRNFTLGCWAAFGLSLILLIGRAGEPALAFGPFRLDAMALFLGSAVLLVSAVVHSFSLRHMDGDARFDAFFKRLAALTATVLALLVTDAVPLFAGLWMLMGWLLADAIGHVRSWPQAQAAAATARTAFLRGGAALTAGLILLSLATGSLSIAGIAAGAAQASPWLVGPGLLALVLAAAIQSGLFPFQRWLMSSMVAPTPVSAFMHAGLVNAGGILVARFSSAFEAVPAVLLIIFAAGAASALLGQVTALVQTDVKRGLAASTTAQMGFMLLQCGLGFHAAAMAHLVLHGLYKASLFLGAGSALANAAAPKTQAAPSLAAAGPAAIAALLAGAGFALTSGKLEVGAGALLVLFAALAAAQAGLALRGDGLVRWLAGPAVLGLAGLLYGLIVRGAEALLAGTPGLVAPQALNPLHLLVAALFLLAWVAIQAGWHRRSAALYVRALRLGQPAPASVTDRRETYHA
ncbi:proton-conducting transporter transmembrane domain-containing protein [Falsiroseomonas oryziterrae]|uniref:proton-conducting transporter transmembrane domain-containing protein n=1 Tax=Falsiroseomonas oryziterrae TaxID=2911368 RepID=UPI001F2C7AB0|nr:proton-conducting transporter membrane subunit [Roseomonas sp. NPKOSM-4]